MTGWSYPVNKWKDTHQPVVKVQQFEKLLFEETDNSKLMNPMEIHGPRQANLVLIASAQSRQNLRCSLIQAVSQEEPSDRKPDPWPLWMAGHAQLKCVMTECSKTQIRLTRTECSVQDSFLSPILYSLYTHCLKSHITRQWKIQGLKVNVQHLQERRLIVH